MSVIRVVNGMPENGEPDLGMLVIQADYDFPVTFRGEVFNQFYQLIIRHVSSEDLYALSRNLHRDADSKTNDWPRALDAFFDIQEVLKDPFKVVDTTGRNRGIWWVPTNIVE